MKIEWINNGNEFELPKKVITVEDEIEILRYLALNGKDDPDIVKRLNEITYTIYIVLRKIDKNVTFDIVKNNVSTEEAGILNLLFRTKGQLSYNCPHCNKSFLYMNIIKKERENDKDSGGSDKNFQKHPRNGTMKTKKTI